MTIELSPEEFALVFYALGVTSGKLWQEGQSPLDGDVFFRLGERLEQQWRHRHDDRVHPHA